MGRRNANIPPGFHQGMGQPDAVDLVQINIQQQRLIPLPRPFLAQISV